MNLIWNKNITLFKKRFPQLSKLLEKSIEKFEKYAGTENENALYPFWKISESKSGNIIAQENGLRLHSCYDPQKEAENFIKNSFNKFYAEIKKNNEEIELKALVFLGFGLGYMPLAAAKNMPEKIIILIEPEPFYFFSALLFMDWNDIFYLQNIILIISCPPEQVLPILGNFGILNSIFLSTKAYTQHSEKYFDVLSTLISRNREKEKINNATLKRFYKLWIKNSKKNLEYIKLLDSIDIFEKQYEKLPFLILAAGPSLQEIIKFLPELKKRMIIICVDTALTVCLKSGVEPDFIIIADPQYWAYRHIAGLHSASSVLIAEEAVYPSVFRFFCKKIVWFSSGLPIEDKKIFSKESILGAGGSVASAAWCFAKFAGADSIYFAGLDFAFPKKLPHVRGSLFEQAAHTCSLRTFTAETQGMPSLFSANICEGLDYSGEAVFTDQKMKMFAWWFESNIAASPDIKNYTLSCKGLAVPGIIPANIEDVLKLKIFFN